MLPVLYEIMDGLKCYGLMDVMKLNENVFHHVFCPSNIYQWSFETFQNILKPTFNEDGSSMKQSEVNIFKYFMEFAEECFLDGKICLSYHLYKNCSTLVVEV